MLLLQVFTGLILRLSVQAVLVNDRSIVFDTMLLEKQR